MITVDRARRCLTRVGITLIVAGASLAGLARPSEAQDQDESFVISAEANTMLVELSAPDAGLAVGAQIANATPARALAQVDSLSTSRALAAAGYPGDLPFTLPGTVIGLLAGFDGIRDLVPLLPPVPDYPLAVQSDLVNPSATTESGVFAVTADTDAHESHADARLGVDALGVTALSTRATARSTFDPETSALHGEAAADVTGIRLAGLLDVSQRTTGKITLANGTPTTDIDSFLGVSLVGSKDIRVGFGPNGLTAAGNTLVDRAVIQTLLSSLSALGITIDYVPETRSQDGSTVTSAGMRITERFTVPDEAKFLNDLGLPLNASIGRVIATITIGQVTLRAETERLDAPTFGGNESPPSPTVSGADGGGEVFPTDPESPASTTIAPQRIGVTPKSTDPLTLSASSFYLVLVGAAVSALGSSRAVGALAVRLRF